MSNVNIRQLKDPVSGDVFYPQTDIAGLVSGGGPGIDAVPTAGSVKPVQSGGVYEKIYGTPANYSNGYYDASGAIAGTSGTTYFHNDEYIPVSQGDTITWIYSSGTYAATVRLILYNSSKVKINDWGANDSSGKRTFTVSTAGAAYIRASFWTADKNIACIKKGDDVLYSPIDAADGDVVLVRQQALTSEQKEIARNNIGAIQMADIPVDDVPVNNSNNFTKSGGIYNQKAFSYVIKLKVPQGKYIDIDTTNRKVTIPSGSIIMLNHKHSSYDRFYNYVTLDEDVEITSSMNEGTIKYNETDGTWSVVSTVNLIAKDDYFFSHVSFLKPSLSEVSEYDYTINGNTLAAMYDSNAKANDALMLKQINLRADVLDNRSITSSGTTASDGNYVSGLIPCEAGDSVAYRNTQSGDHYMAFYNSEKKPIANERYKAYSTNAGRVVTAPENAKYVRIDAAYTGGEYWLKVNGTTMWDRYVSSEYHDDKSVQTFVANGDVKYGYRFDSTRYLVADPEWLVSDFIKVSASTAYYIKNGITDNNKSGICFYNSNYEYISGSRSRSNLSKTSVASPATAVYARVAFYLPNIDDCYLKVKSSGALVWEYKNPYVQLLDSKVSAAAGKSGIVELNRNKDNVLLSMRGKSNPNGADSKYLTLLHCTDLHDDAARTKRIIEYANAHKNVIHGIISTGDFVRNNYNDSGFENTYAAYYDKTELPWLFIIGNHEAGVSGTTIGTYNGLENTVDNCTARFITPYMERAGAIQGNNGAGGYFYKDYTTYKIRIIGINEYELPRVKNSGETAYKYNVEGRYISQTQADWLVSTLNSMESGWSCVILTHQLIDAITQYSDNEFTSTTALIPGDSRGYQGMDMVQDIVDAFISKSTLAKTYASGITGATEQEVPTVSVNADFSNAHGDFIGYFNGHAHSDHVGESSVATNKQVNINLCASNANGYHRANDMARIEGMLSEDAFNIVCFDTDRKRIRILRIGADTTFDMTRRFMTSIPYV